MNRGLVYKSFREWLPITLGIGILVVCFETVLAYVAPTFEGEIGPILKKISWLKGFIESLMGAQIGNQLDAYVVAAIPWVQPVLLITYISHGAIGVSRIPANEIERKTIDWVMALPVSRTQLFVIETTVWLINGLFVTFLLLGANLLGQSFVQNENSETMQTSLLIALNAFLLYCACGAIAWLASMLIDRRMVVIGIALSVLFVSLILNFLVPIWEVAQQFQFLSILHYYKPYVILKEGSLALEDLGVLAGITAVCWTAALCIFQQRDLASV